MPNSKHIFDVRVENVRLLMREHGGPARLAEKLGTKGAQSQLSQIAGPNPTRPIGESLARKIESRLGLPDGWLDRPRRDMQNEANGADMLKQAFDLVSEKIEEMPNGARIPQKKVLELVRLVSERARITGHVDETYLDKLLILIG